MTLYSKENCGSCGEPIAFVPLGNGKFVCLEAKPWPGDGHPALYWLDSEGIAQAWKNKPGVEVYACHTSRPGHESYRRR